MIFILISLLTLILSIILFKKAAGTLSLLKLNMISFVFYYPLLIESFIGVNIAILGLDNHYLLSRITDNSIRLTTYFAVIYVMIALPLSMVIMSFIARFNAKRELYFYTKKPIQSVITKYDSAIYLSMCILSIIAFASTLYTFITIGRIPLLDMIIGKDSNYLAQLRISASRNFAGNVYIRNILMLGLTPILSYIAFSYYKLYSNKKWKRMFVFLFITSIFAYTYDLAKAPVLWYIISFLFLNVLIKGSISRKLLISIGLLTLTLIVAMYLLLGGATQISTFLSINTGPIGRILLGQITPLFYHFKIFPEMVPFLHGQSFPQSILSLFGMESIRSGRIVMSIVNPKGISSGTAGVMNTLFIGEAYANFGWLGVILGTIYVGFLIQLIYILFLRLPKNPLALGLFTYFTVKIPGIVTGGFIDFIYNAGFIMVVILVVCIFILGQLFQGSVANTKKRQSVV